MTTTDEGAILILTTLPDPAAAKRMVARLVERRLVACGTVVPGVTSVYRWQGNVETARETQVILKTRGARRGEAEAAVAALHPYEVPEILVIEVSGGAESYLRWIEAETSVTTEDAQ
ncbi:MAG TPA: divalent-cation tolerance protein CutA [Gemmatimonadales bacterium]|jgi:periplasmic divalent cation tolerance protein